MLGQKIGVRERVDDVFGEPVVRKAHLVLHDTISCSRANVSCRSAIAPRAAPVFDSIGRPFRFGQATKYGHMTKIEAQGARRLIDRSGEAAAGNANYRRTGDPRFEIDKAARNDKRNGL
jgi:hypothetical protein